MEITSADKWFSIYIRLRDSDENGYCKCITCGRIVYFKNLDCGHFVGRQHQGTRFHEKNCHAQCKKCNGFEEGQKAEYERVIIERYGQQTRDLLKSAERTSFKRSKLEIKLLTEEFKKKAQQLAKDKGLKI